MALNDRCQNRFDKTLLLTEHCNGDRDSPSNQDLCTSANRGGAAQNLRCGTLAIVPKILRGSENDSVFMLQYILAGQG